MVKYYNTMVVFEEIPNEITLAINITNCPCKCVGCHSQYLWEDVGEELTFETLNKLIEKDKGITCICFMGGDGDVDYINSLGEYMRKNFKDLRVAWYSGRDEMSEKIVSKNFDYIKIGHYDMELGPLNNKTTNQILYKVENGELNNITELFWKR